MLKIKKHIFFLILSFLTLSGFCFTPARADNKPTTQAKTHGSLLGLPAHPVVHSAQTQSEIELGRKLFFEKRLSKDGTLSCASCHNPEQAFTQTDRKTPQGIDGQLGRRNAPSLLNVAYLEYFHWDGQEQFLKTQYILPLTSPFEMGNSSIGSVIARLTLLDDYPELFQKTYGSSPSADTIGRALASYQSTLISANSRFDQWYFGKRDSALSEREKAGFALFTGKGQCVSCHQIGKTEALFTDHGFHDIGHGWEQAQKSPNTPPDFGRYQVTRQPIDKWRFKTPSLRNVTRTAPYMHDGAFATLSDVIQFYSKGGAPHPGQDDRIRKLDLTEQDIADLIAFLGTLEGEQ